MKMETIASRDNRRVVLARKVRDGKDRDLIFIEGVRLVREALSSNLEIEQCFAEEGFRETDLLNSISDEGVPVLLVKIPVFRRLAATEHSQGVILLARRPSNQVRIGIPGVKVPLYLYLHKANNPSNLGAVLRSLEAAGAAGAFVSRGSTDVFSPKSLRASMGSAFRVPIGERADLDEVLSQARSKGIGCVGLDARANASYLDVDWTRPHVLFCGSEAHGLSAEMIEKIGGSVSIPIESQVDSLNLAVAAGIVLFEARRQCGLA